MKKLLLILSFIALFSAKESSAQEWALKSNLLYDATTTINLGFETALAEKWTFDLSGNWNPFQFEDNMKWKHWLIQPEFRYWTCRKFGGHFFAAHLLGGQYNFGNLDGLPNFLGSDLSQLADHRYEGWYAGAGVGYGYAWMLGKHWNLEAEIGVGAAYTNFEKYECPKCGKLVGTDDHIYYGLTKLAINLVYLF
jgi:hypothetical protein